MLTFIITFYNLVSERLENKSSHKYTFILQHSAELSCQQAPCIMCVLEAHALRSFREESNMERLNNNKRLLNPRCMYVYTYTD